jgi:2-keto-4-pentenoate hydratase/2-oxohepta-3-ene-1,7-dioic acid hydratase in catechol pathway
MGFRLANIDGRAVLVDGTSYYDIAELTGNALGPDPMDAIADVPALHELADRLGDTEPTGSIDGAAIGPPIPRPRNSYGIGLNYRSHVAESNMEVPTVPLVFTKFPSCIVGPTADVELGGKGVDYEAELVVVIGKAARNVEADAAWDHVAGLTVGQDVSDRRLQFASKPPHFDLGKSRDTYGPIGPVLVSPDLLDDPASLAITCDINDERRQDGTTSDLIFDIPALIAYLSAIMTLAPGDLIFTGTPEGVGAADGKFLVAGDVITTTIEGIGTMVNRCR